MGRDLFAAPETYEFAPCEPVSFFEAWCDAREDAVRLFAERERATVNTSDRAADSAPLGARTLDDILESLLKAAAAGGPLAPADKRTVDSLLQKFEIFRRLFTHYDGAMRKWDGAALAGPDHYILLAEVLGAWCAKTGNPKYLSTMLKAVDALCALPAESLSASAATRLAAVVEQERRLVDHWVRVAGE
ncbi:MAG: hypothetical protein FJX65_17790 [Alphaproteobacteria bacterium]|nr:hypothetical protein [Alphaproteobacteria bacterium]